MKRKFWSLLLVLALLVGVLPATALADNDEHPMIWIAGKILTPGYYLDASHIGEGACPIDEESMPTSGYAAYTEYKDGTARLILNNFNLDCNGENMQVSYTETSGSPAAAVAGDVLTGSGNVVNAAIYSSVPLAIQVEGSCSLTLHATDVKNYQTFVDEDSRFNVFTRRNCGILCDSSLSITGSDGAALALNDVYLGVLCYSLSIQKLTVTSNSYVDSVLATGDLGTGPRSMTLCQSTIAIDNKSSLKGAGAGDAAVNSVGLLTVDHCTVKINKSLNNALHCSTRKGNNNLPPDILIRDSELKLTNCDKAIKAEQNVSISGSRLTVDGTRFSGLEADGELEITDSEAALTNCGKDALCAENDIQITKSVLSFTNIGRSGIRSKDEDVAINGSTVTIEHVGTTFDDSKEYSSGSGIKADDALTITGSDVTVNGAAEHGLCASGFSVLIEDSDVSVNDVTKNGIYFRTTYTQKNSKAAVTDIGQIALMQKPSQSPTGGVTIEGSYLLLQGEEGVMNLAPQLSEAMKAQNRASVNLNGSRSAPFDPEKLATYRFAEFGVGPEKPVPEPEEPDWLLPILPFLGAAAPFGDVAPGDWFYDHVCTLYNEGVLDGYPDGTFRPQSNVTWGEALKLVLLLSGYEYQPPVNDHWASGYLAAARAEGIVGSVNLDAPINRLDMAHLVAKAQGVGANADLHVFADCNDGYVNALYDLYILEGSFVEDVRYYFPNSNLTRAEFAAILDRL